MALERITMTNARARSGGPNPTRAKVHPNSRLAGTFEDDFFFSYAKGETDRIYARAAELEDQKNAIRRSAKAEGRALSPDEQRIMLLTPGALKILKVLLDLARTCAGKVFPTWAWIEQKSGRSRATVHRALTNLAAVGLLDKQRRCVPIKPTLDRPKAKNEQTSNVYRMRFPNCLVRFLPHRMRPLPLPDDVLQGEADRIEAIASMRLWRSPRQVATEDFNDDGLRRVMLNLATAVERQESQKNGQPLQDSYNLRKYGIGLAGQRFNA
ncbi:RNA replicase [Sphingomonas sp. LB2R24]